MSEQSAPTPFRIYCDFDGTIASTDIGCDLFDRFGTIGPWDDQVRAGILPVRGYWQARIDTLVQPLTDEQVDAYLNSIPVDEGFADLVGFATEHNLPFTVVSDGLDFYVGRYLALNGFPDLPFYCNLLVRESDGSMSLGFPHAAENCECAYRSITCKRNLVVTLTPPEERIVYIGDGISDFCPAEHADIVFAKGELAAFCNAHRIPHYPFGTLREVTEQLEKLLLRKRIRVRHQAALRRKALFEGE